MYLNKYRYSQCHRVRLHLQHLLHDGSGYTKIYSTVDTFAALKADGSIKAWGSPVSGVTSAPAGNDYTKIYSSEYAF
jgi:hypothetical protein